MKGINTPPKEAAVLPLKTRVWYFLVLNRMQFGLVLLALAAAIGSSISPDNIVGHKWLQVVVLLVVLITGASAGTAIGGAQFKSNSWHKDEMHIAIRKAYQRNAAIGQAKAEAKRVGPPLEQEFGDTDAQP